jgi:hypothetical protein
MYDEADNSSRNKPTRRRLLKGSAGLIGSAVAGRALADTLADVPAR